MRKYLTTILLASTFFLSEVHTFWEKGYVHVENWILASYKPMPIQWNVKFASLQFIYIIWFAAWLLYVPNRVNKTTVRTVFYWTVIDTIMYFYNFKNYEYAPVYLWIIGVWLLVFFWTRWTGWIWKHLN